MAGVSGQTLNLSLLSRGIGEVQQNGHERVEVVLEPEDYFNFVRDRKRLYLPPIKTKYFAPDPTETVRTLKKLELPKTFTTRRGALLLFSEDFAIRDESRVSHHKNIVSHSLDNVGSLDLKTVDDLAKSILSYGKEEAEEDADVYLGFVHKKRKFNNQRQIRPGFSAKRYLSTWTRIWDDSLLENVISKGYITERSLFYGSMVAPSLRRRIFHDDLSHYPQPYRLMRNMLISPGSLSGYTFYMKDVDELEQVDEEEELDTRQLSRQKTQPAIAVVKTRNGVQREVNYSNLDKQSQKDVLTDLLVKSAVNYALQKQQEFVETMKNPSPEIKASERQMDAFDMKEAVESLLESEKENREFEILTQKAANDLSSPASSSTWPYDEYKSQVQLPSLDDQSRQLSTIEDVSREGTGLKVLPPIGHGEGMPSLHVAPATPREDATDQVTQTSALDDGDSWAAGLNEDSLLKQGNQTNRQGGQIQIDSDKTKLPAVTVPKGPFQAKFASDTEYVNTSRHAPAKPLQKRSWGGSTQSLTSKRSSGSMMGDGSLKGSLIAAPGGEIVRVGGSVAQSSIHGDVANLNDVTPRRTSVYHMTDDSDAEEMSASQRSDKRINSSSGLYGYRRSRGLSIGDLDATMSLKSFSFSRKDTDEEVASMSSFLPPVLKLEGDKNGVEADRETEVKDWDKITEYPELEGVETNRSQVITENSETPSPKKSVRVATQASDPIQEIADFNSIHPESPNLESSYESIQKPQESAEDDANDEVPKDEMISIDAPVTMVLPVPRIELQQIPKTEITIDNNVSDAYTSSGVESGARSYRQKKLTKRKKKKSAVPEEKERIPTSTPRKGALSPLPGMLGLPQLSIRSLSHSDISHDIARLKTPSPSRRRASIVQMRSPTKDLGQIELTSAGIHAVEEPPKTNRDKKQLPANYRHRKIMRRRIRKKSIPLVERRRPPARVRAEVKSLPNPKTGDGEDHETDFEETWCETLSPTFWEDNSSEYESEYFYDDGEKLGENDLAELKELSKSMSSINDGSMLSDNRISGSGLHSNQTSSRLNSTRSSQSKNSEVVNTVDEEPVTEEGIVTALTEHAQAIAEHILVAGGGMNLEEDIRKAALLWMKTHPARKISRSQSVQEMGDSNAVDAVMKAQRINSAGPTTAEYKEILKKSITAAVANATGVDVDKLALESDISDELIEALVNQEISPDDVKVVKDPLTGRSQLTTSRSASLKDGHLYAEANGEEKRTVSIPSARSSVKDLGDVDIISYMASETIDLSADHSDTQSKGSSHSKPGSSHSIPGSSHSKPGSVHSKPPSVTGQADVKTPSQEVVSEVAEVKVTEAVATVTEPVIEKAAEVVEAKQEEPVSIISNPVEKTPEPQIEKEPIQTQISTESKKSPESTKSKPVKLEEREQFVIGKAKQDKENEKLYGAPEQPPPRKTSIAKVTRKPSITKTQEPPKLSTEQLPVPEQDQEPEKQMIVNEKPEKPQPVPVEKKDPPKPKAKTEPAKKETKKKEPEKKTKLFIPPPGAPKSPPKPDPPKPRNPPAPPEEKKAVDPGKPKEKKAKATPVPKPKEEKKKKPVKKGKKAKKEIEEPVPPVVEEVAPTKPKEPSPPPPPKTTSPRLESALSDVRSVASSESDGPDFIIIRDRSPTPEPPALPEPVPSPAKQPPPPPVVEEVPEEEEDPAKLNLISSKDARAAKRAVAAAKKREEVERKRKEREEEGRKEKERQDRERQREIEADDARRRQEEQRRLRKLQEETDRQREELESREREKRRLQDIEKEKRMKEEQKKKFDEMRRRQLEDEQKRLELVLLRQAEEEEQWRLEEEKKALMEEEERLEYEKRKKEEEELRIQREAEEKRKREEEAARLMEEERQKAIAEARKRMEIEARLKFNRSLQLEANGLSEHSHKLSEAFVFSYFEILQWLGLNIPEFELAKLGMDIPKPSQ